jgi:CheY-like chemotaxis protein
MKPVLAIVCVEDELEVLESVVRDLEQFEDDFRIETATSVQQAECILEELKAEGINVALFICDHLMPEVTGVDPALVRNAVQLAEAGQKEIFDVQTVAALAKHVGVEDKILEYVPSLLEATDRLGRIIFLLNWDTDKFIEMYGRGDLSTMSELINSVFKNLGELIIFLKRRSPELTINMNKDEALNV